MLTPHTVLLRSDGPAPLGRPCCGIWVERARPDVKGGTVRGVRMKIAIRRLEGFEKNTVRGVRMKSAKPRKIFRFAVFGNIGVQPGSRLPQARQSAGGGGAYLHLPRICCARVPGAFRDRDCFSSSEPCSTTRVHLPRQTHRKTNAFFRIPPPPSLNSEDVANFGHGHSVERPWSSEPPG